jgi:phytoene dehydrogenase-like protein
LLTTRLLGWRDKIETGRLLGGIPRLDPAAWQGKSVAEWIAAATSRPRVRELLGALVRVATYANAPEEQSAAAALRQLQLALKANVLYLDGGWQTIVDGLSERARGWGVEIQEKARVAAITIEGGSRGVRLAGGERLAASAVVLALSPHEASSLIDDGRNPHLKSWAEGALPVKAACLDLGLRRLPRADVLFTLGIDRPLYLSVHSASAALAPDGQALVHVLEYQAPDQHDSREQIQGRLEALLDRMQPGWRELVLERRFMPQMVVSHALHRVAQPRPQPEVPGITGLFVAGDWVGERGMLADAAVASAKAAVDLLLRQEEAAAA